MIICKCTLCGKEIANDDGTRREHLRTKHNICRDKWYRPDVWDKTKVFETYLKEEAIKHRPIVDHKEQKKNEQLFSNLGIHNHSSFTRLHNKRNPEQWAETVRDLPKHPCKLIISEKCSMCDEKKYSGCRIDIKEARWFFCYSCWNRIKEVLIKERQENAKPKVEPRNIHM